MSNNDINFTMQIGRLTRDAELKYTNTGKAISSFSIAVNEVYTSNGQKVEYVNFFDVNLWGKIAEALNPYLLKGKQVAVTGKLKQDRWQDDNGHTRSKIKINCQNVQLLGSKNQGGNQGYQGNQNSYGNQGKPQNQNSQTRDDFQDDIPF